MTASEEILRHSPTQLQERQLTSLLRRAAATVPYYREVLSRRSGGTPPAMEAWDAIPLLSKETVQERWKDFFSSRARMPQLLYTWTSGSTGQPLLVGRTQEEQVVALRHLVQARLRAGLRLPTRAALIADRTSYISGNSQLARATSRSGSDFLMIPSISASDGLVEGICRKLSDFQPTWLYCPPSLASDIAASIDALGIRLTRLELIELAGDFIDPADRNRIEAKFGSVVRGQYGCQEVLGIAFECEFGYYHVFDDHVFLEVLDQDGCPAPVGQAGQAVVTGLNQYVMPFIRYKLGDLLRPIAGRCECGSGRRRVDIVQGRRNELIAGASGKSGTAIFESVSQYVSEATRTLITQFRVVQRTYRDFDVFIACCSGWWPIQETLFVQTAQRAIGRADLRFRFRVGKTVPRLASGKRVPFMVQFSPPDRNG